jgi:ABC-type methionine transport system permease subunit
MAARYRPTQRHSIAARATEGLDQWIVLLHVFAAFTFALAHGVSAGVALKLRGEREIPRVQALLDLSQAATNGMYVSVFVLLIARVAAAFADLWGRSWILAAIVLLVLMFVAMYARA